MLLLCDVIDLIDTHVIVCVDVICDGVHNVYCCCDVCVCFVFVVGDVYIVVLFVISVVVGTIG